MSRIGVVLSSLRERSLARIRAKHKAFLGLPVISTVNTKLRHWVSPENRDLLRSRYHDAYHWVAGTEVTEVQERARYLESKLNFNRKDMREARQQLETVVERLRNITSELERTGRGDVKAIHLRQQEYETIQEEMRLHKVVQKAEYEERETFSLLMNTVRESHETERNYNQRIKMISLIGAILGPFVGYLFSARLNAMRFRKMEDIIDKKLNDLSLVTVNAIKTIHGLPVDIDNTENEQPSFFENLQLYLMHGYDVALSSSRFIVEQFDNLIKSFQQSDQPGSFPLATSADPQAPAPSVSSIAPASECRTTGTQTDSSPDVGEQVVVSSITGETGNVGITANEHVNGDATGNNNVPRDIHSELRLIQDNQTKLLEYLTGERDDDTALRSGSDDKEELRRLITSILTPHTERLSKSISEVTSGFSTLSHDISDVMRQNGTLHPGDISRVLTEVLHKSDVLYDNLRDIRAVQDAGVVSEVGSELRQCREALDSLSAQIETTLTRIVDVVNTPSASTSRDTAEVRDAVTELKTISHKISKLSLVEDRMTEMYEKLSDDIDNAIAKVIKAIQSRENQEIRAFKTTNDRIESLINAIETASHNDSIKGSIKIADSIRAPNIDVVNPEITEEREIAGLGFIYTSFVALSTLLVLLGTK